MIVKINLTYSVTPSKIKKIGGFYVAEATTNEDITTYDIRKLVCKSIKHCAKTIKERTEQ